MSEVSRLIRNRRKELGLTLEEVGNAVGVGKSTVLKWENGKIANLRIDKIIPLLGVLRIYESEFMNALRADARQ